MKVEFKEKNSNEVNGDVLILVLTKEDVVPEKRKKGKRRISSLLGKHEDILESAISRSEFEGDKGQQLTIHTTGNRRAMILCGSGERSQLSNESLRRAAAAGLKAGQALKAKSIVISALEPTVEQCGDYETVHSLLEGAKLAAYKFDKYLTEDKKSSKVEQILVAMENVKPAIGAKAARDVQLICDAVFLARDLSNAPASEIYPETLARAAAAMGRAFRVRVTVLDEKKIRSLRMGGLLAVNSGSTKPPRFIIMEYYGNRKSRDIYAIIGKGITFDSGGISLKPAAGMGEMKMDMSGAAAVIGTIQAVASLKLPVNVVALAPATENLPGGSAYKPGDVVTTMSGKTIEVDNTDAEGRIILSDALFYAQKYKPKAIIDLATLTGAVVVALGHHATGMFGTADEVMLQLKDAGEKTYERVWQLPIFEEYEKQIKSDIADVKNTGGRWGGAITAALFLKKFVGDYPWVHLDIAGTAMLEDASDYSPRGGSGVGVRLLTQFFKQISA
ncbi:MAG TPA: leucyl aminopeptidase [Candidatus Kryptonia bacterium]